MPPGVSGSTRRLKFDGLVGVDSSALIYINLSYLHVCHPERSEGSHVRMICFVALSMTRLFPTCVTLSEAKGLSLWVTRCFAALSMTEL
jgi:hypothetical protein